MRREERIELGAAAGVDPYRLHPDPGDRSLLGQPFGAFYRYARRVGARLVGVEEGVPVVGVFVPARAQQQPAVLRQ